MRGLLLFLAAVAFGAVKVGEVPPEIKLDQLMPAGASVNALKGRPVVVNFWATWCGPCKEEMPSLAKLAKDYADRGVKVVPISVDRLQDGQAAKDFLRGHGNLGFYNDPEYRVVFGLNPRPDGIPTTVIYDKSGKEQARLSGGADWSTEQAKKVMDAVIAKG